MTKQLLPGDVVGILGGGQLARMLALSAARLGLKTHIFCPDPDSPAFDVAAFKTVAAYDDQLALKAFGEAVNAVTYEFENVPFETASFLETMKPLFPNSGALRIIQDRLLEKNFIRDAGQPVGIYKAIDTCDDLKIALSEFGCPAVLKTRRFGYDGKGQVLIREKDECEKSFTDMKGQPIILEAFVEFEREISLVAARSQEGEIVIYDAFENEHENHILRYTRIAGITERLRAKGHSISRALLESLDYVGVMAIEMFVIRDETGEEQLLVNELAPRVHNSGHITEALCFCSQFEQHIRAISGWPLGSVLRHSTGVMENILGSESDQWLELASKPGVLHLYGKKDVREGRKMGHITHIE